MTAYFVTTNLDKSDPNPFSVDPNPFSSESSGLSFEELFLLEKEEQARLKAEERANDPRQIFDVKLGSEYETVGEINTGCTVTDLGDGYAISAAHCFLGGISTPITRATKHYLVLGCEAENYEDTSCEDSIRAKVEEIAVPTEYSTSPIMTSGEDDYGYDIAFIRYQKPSDEGWPSQNFSLQTQIHSSSVLQIGKSYDRGGVTGGECEIFDSSHEEYKSEFIITTNCFVKPGDSGSPLFDTDNQLVAVMESIPPNNSWDSSISYATPITEGLLDVFDKFKKGELQGEIETSPNNTKVVRFEYEREPVNYQFTPES